MKFEKLNFKYIKGETEVDITLKYPKERKDFEKYACIIYRVDDWKLLKFNKNIVNKEIDKKIIINFKFVEGDKKEYEKIIKEVLGFATKTDYIDIIKNIFTYIYKADDMNNPIFKIA